MKFEIATLVCFTLGWISKTPIGRSRMEVSRETSAKAPTESFDLCDLSADDNMERRGGTKESNNVSTIQEYFSHFLFRAIPCFAILRDSIRLTFLSICIRCE